MVDYSPRVHYSDVLSQCSARTGGSVMTNLQSPCAPQNNESMEWYWRTAIPVQKLIAIAWFRTQTRVFRIGIGFCYRFLFKMHVHCIGSGWVWLHPLTVSRVWKKHEYCPNLVAWKAIGQGGVCGKETNRIFYSFILSQCILTNKVCWSWYQLHQYE